MVVLTSSIVFAPVQLAFPLLKRSVAVFGFFNRYTNPGNCSGSYSASSNDCAITSRSNLSAKDVDATIFCTFISIIYYYFPLNSAVSQFLNGKTKNKHI